MITHNLKLWPQFFERVEDGSKTFEVRTIEDRDFQTGDFVFFDEWCPKENRYSGKQRLGPFVITYVLHPDRTPGLDRKVVFSFRPAPPVSPEEIPS